MGDRLGLGRLALWIPAVFRVGRGRDSDAWVSACDSSSKGSRSLSAIGGVATALGKEAWAAASDGLAASSNLLGLGSEAEVMNDKALRLVLLSGSSSVKSGVCIVDAAGAAWDEDEAALRLGSRLLTRDVDDFVAGILLNESGDLGRSKVEAPCACPYHAVFDLSKSRGWTSDLVVSGVWYLRSMPRPWP